MEVAGKAVLVAGGAGNLGSAIVSDLRARGARVAVLDARTPAQAQPGDVYVQADAADESSVAAALASVVEQCGNVWALVNCTGTIHSEPLVNLLDRSQRRHRVATWDAVVRSNLTATFVVGAVVAEHMAATRTKGVIVNFSSIAAGGNAGQTAYAASKAGVEAMTVAWARELGPLGIRAVAIAPGFVDVPSTHAAVNEKALADLKSRTPLRRFATAQEIASAVAFAIENDFLTGRILGVDGGLAL